MPTAPTALTPMIKEVDGTGVGPWVSAGGTLRITALGDFSVPNNAYNGPAATTAPYNQRTIVRHYGFGACTAATSTGTGPCSVALIGADGVAHALTGVSWSDLLITGTVAGAAFRTARCSKPAILNNAASW